MKIKIIGSGGCVSTPRFRIKEVIMTHLEEDWGKSYDDYLALEKEYDGIWFAYDGMEV